MTVLKIGERFLNVDRGTEYTVEGTVVIVHFGPDQITRFARHDAAQLRRWLERTAVDLAHDEVDPSPDRGGGSPEPRYRFGGTADAPRPSRR